MRTYINIVDDYLKFLAVTRKDTRYNPTEFFKGYENEVAARAFIFKRILQKIRDRKIGMFYFCKFIIGDLRELGFKKEFRYNNLLKQWDRISKETKRAALESARGHGKSTFWSIILPIYRSTIRKHYKILLESASSPQAEENLRTINFIIDNNEYLFTMKSKAEVQRNDHLSYNNGFIKAKGFGSEVRGLHLDLIIVDDILRSDNKLSDQEIEDFIDEELEPMLLERNGQLIIVGTPKSNSDIFSTLKERLKDSKSSWKFYVFPAILDFEERTLQCPDRFTWSAIMQKKADMGTRKFNKEYQCEVYDRQSSLFPPEVLDTACKLGLDFKVLNHSNTEETDEARYCIGVDCARSGKASADYTVVTVLKYIPSTNRKYICHIWREKGLRIQEQIDHIVEIANKFNHAVVLVEKNNMGTDFIDLLAVAYNGPLETFTTGARNQSKDDLIRLLISAFENELMIIPRADEESKDVTDLLIIELARFGVEKTPAGNETYKGLAGSHDDMVMSLALANKCTQSNSSIPTAFTEADLISNKHDSELEFLIKMGLIK